MRWLLEFLVLMYHSNSIWLTTHPIMSKYSCHPTSSYVWPNINIYRLSVIYNVRNQRCKDIQHHRLARPDANIHIDIVGPLPPSKGNAYLLTCIDRFTRWPEVITSQLTPLLVHSSVLDVQIWCTIFCHHWLWMSIWICTMAMTDKTVWMQVYWNNIIPPHC